MRTQSSLRFLPAILGLVVAVTAGLAGVSHLKFKSFLSDSVNERVQIVAATSARDFAAATDLGLSIPEVASGDIILERARAHDPLIRSIVVFGLDGVIIHSVGEVANDRIGAGMSEAFRLAREGITDPTWSTERSGRIQSGTVITGGFGQPLGGVVVEYPTNHMGDQIAEMRRALTRDGIVVAGAMSAIMLTVFILIRSQLVARDDEHASRLPVVSVSLVLIAGVALFGALIVRNFNRSLEPELNRRASLIGETIRDDTEMALGYGIPLDELVGVEEYFGLFLEEFPELDYVALYNDQDRVVAVVAEGASGGGETESNPVPSVFDPANARSVVHGFEIFSGSEPAGSVELGVDPGYVRSKLSDLGLDVIVILIVAIVIALEVTRAITGRITDRLQRESIRRRRPADVRLVLLIFAISEELNKSFLPLFIKAADNPTGLDVNLAISLPIVAYLLTVAVTSPWAGRIVLAVGQRRLLLTGLTAAALSHLGMIFAGNVLQIVGLRALTGFGYAVATISCMEYLLERLSPGNRSRSVGVFVTVVIGGTFAGTALGGIFADRLGYDAVFITSFGLVVLTGVFAMSLLEPGTQYAGSDEADFSFGDIAAVVRQRSLAALISGVTIPMNVVMAAFLWYLVPLTLDSVGSNASAIARTLMLYYLVILIGGPILERLSGRLRPRTLVGIGSVLSGAVLLVPAASPTPVTILLAVLVVGIGHAAIRGPQFTLAMDIAERSLPGSGRGAILAAMRSLERLGSLVGLLAIAVMASRSSLEVAIGTVGVAAAVTGVGFLATGPFLSRSPTDG